MYTVQSATTPVFIRDCGTYLILKVLKTRFFYPGEKKIKPQRDPEKRGISKTAISYGQKNRRSTIFHR